MKSKKIMTIINNYVLLVYISSLIPTVYGADVNDSVILNTNEFDSEDAIFADTDIDESYTTTTTTNNNNHNNNQNLNNTSNTDTDVDNENYENINDNLPNDSIENNSNTITNDFSIDAVDIECSDIEADIDLESVDINDEINFDVSMVAQDTSILTSYIDGASKIYLNDANSDVIVSDTWNFNETKILKIQADVSGLDASTRYLKINLPLGMKLHSDPNLLVDGKIITGVDTSNFAHDYVLYNGSSKYTPNDGELIFEISKDVSFVSLDLIVSVDGTFWSTVNGASATSDSEKAITITVGDDTSFIQKKMDKVYITGRNWSQYFDNGIASSLMNDTDISMRINTSIDYIQNVFNRIYRNVKLYIEIPKRTYVEDGVEKTVYADIVSITNYENSTYEIVDNVIIFQWNNAMLRQIKPVIVFNLNSADFPDESRVSIRRGKLVVEDYFTGEESVIYDYLTSNYTVISKYKEKIQMTTKNISVYKDDNRYYSEAGFLLGGVNIKSEGALSSTKKISYLFPSGMDSGIGVTSIRMPTLTEKELINVNVSLWDRNTGEIFEGDIIIDKPKASNSYSGYLLTVSEVVSKLSNSLNLSGRELYFKSISYIIGNIPSEYLFYSSGGSDSAASSGNYFGVVFNDMVNGNNSFTTKIIMDTIDDAGAVIDSIFVNSQSNVTSSGTATAGITSFAFYDKNGKTTSNIVSGDDFSVKGNIEASSYPYFSTQYLSKPVLYFKLPKGITIDTEKSIINIVKNGVEKTLSWKINNDYTRELKDGSIVYKIEFNDTSIGIGYYSENLSQISYLRYNIYFKNSRATKTISINVKDFMFVDDEYISMKGSGSWDMYFIKDTNDINSNNNLTDYLGTYRYDTLLNISSNTSWLEVNMDSSINGSSFNSNPITVKSVNDLIQLRFNINNSNGGYVNKSDFYYYIPIPKKNLEYDASFKENFEVFDFDLSLMEFIDVPDGFNVLYSTDNKSFVDSSKIKNINDVSMIKIVATKNIESISTSIILNLKVVDSSDILDNNDVVFTAYGYQKYIKNGNEISFSHSLEQISIIAKEEIEDNWLTREVARQRGKSVEDLKNSDFEVITNIDLQNSGLTGEIPSDIGRLKNLKTLYLNDNSLTGEIPSNIHKLEELRVLNLSKNKFIGTIPDSLYSLTKLIELRLGTNSLTGTISKDIKNLTNLTYLELCVNEFSGEIPNEIGYLTKLENLYIGSNNFTGQIPNEIYSLTRLKNLSLNHNSLSGTISSEISNLTNIENLWMCNNKFTGYLPSSIAELSGANIISFKNNQLIGVEDGYPDKFMTETYLEGNFIEGLPNQKEIVVQNTRDIDVTIGDKLSIPNYKNIKVFYNGYEEELSSDYTLEYFIEDSTLFDTKLYAVNIGNTILRAKIKEAEPTNNNALSSNGFSINVKKKYAALKMNIKADTTQWVNRDVMLSVTATSSEDIDYILLPDGNTISDGSRNCEYVVSSNGTYDFKAVTVTGEEVECSIEVNNIDKEKPIATISKHIDFDGSVILTVNASDSLSGIKSISNPEGKVVLNSIVTYDVPCDGAYDFIITDKAGNTEIVSIDISGVVLDETWLAKEVARQVKKDVMDLTIEDFEKITSITLSNKNIKGRIPSYIEHLTNLTTLKLNGNDLRGEIPNEIGVLEKLKVLWLCDNRLIGNIPASIGELVSLEQLDLSLNLLTGEIPSSIGNLPKIKYIYLCENKLTGQIPHEMGNLTTLIDLCMDFNQFIGEVPKEILSLKSRMNFEYNFLENQSKQNKIIVKEDASISLNLNEDINNVNLHNLINISTELSSNNSLSSSYTLEFIPNEEGFFNGTKAIRSGMTYGSIRIAEASYDNISAYSTVPVSVYISINESNLDLEKPQISYSISNKNWTNDDVSINVTASDNLGISKIILPDDTEIYNDSVVYTVSCNGDYTFKAVDVSGNVEVIIISIKNIDKTAPSITVNYDSSVAVNALPLLVVAEDDLSGIDYIKVNNNYINNNEIFVVTENGPYLFEIKDLAGNLSSVIVEITLIKDESNDNTSAPPDVDINNEIPTSPKDENEDSNIIKDDIEDSNCNNDVNNDIKNNDAIIAIINTGNREHVMTYPKSDTYILESIEEEAVLSVANESQSDDKNFIDKTYENNNQNKNQSNTIAEKEKSRSFIPIKTIFILVIASSLVIIYVFIKNRRV